MAKTDGWHDVKTQLNSNTVISGSSQVSYTGLSGIPGGIVSGSEQVNADSITNFDSNVKTKLDVDGVISGSSQVDADTITNFDSNVKAKLDADGVISGSSQLLDQATDFGTGRVSGDNFGDADGGSDFTGSFAGDGSNLTGLVSTLTFGNNGVDSDSTVDLQTQQFDIVGTANEIETSVSGQTLSVGIVTNPTLTGNVVITGDLNSRNNY